MRSRIIVVTVLSIFILSGSIIPQEKQEQKIDLPQLTLEQKHSRLARSMILSAINGVSFAKSQGKTAEDYAKHMVKLFAPSWSGSRGNPIGLIRGTYRNYSCFNSFKMEIFSASETEVKGRMTVFGISYFSGPSLKPSAMTYYGVTLEEYMRFWEVWMEELSDYLGMVYKQEFDGEWINFTVALKK